MKPQKRIEVLRNAGHPWDGRKGFDLLMVEADTPELLSEMVKEAEAKFWSSWLIGMNEETQKPGGVMYKPSGITSPWDDGPKKPHPGGCVARFGLINTHGSSGVVFHEV